MSKDLPPPLLHSSQQLRLPSFLYDPPTSEENTHTHGAELVCELNWYYQLCDEQLSRDFHAFHGQRGFSHFFSFLTLVIVAGVWPAAVYNLLIAIRHSDRVLTLGLSIFTVITTSILANVSIAISLRHSPRALAVCLRGWKRVSQAVRDSLSLCTRRIGLHVVTPLNSESFKFRDRMNSNSFASSKNRSARTATSNNNNNNNNNNSNNHNNLNGMVRSQSAPLSHTSHTPRSSRSGKNAPHRVEPQPEYRAILPVPPSANSSTKSTYTRKRELMAWLSSAMTRNTLNWLFVLLIQLLYMSFFVRYALSAHCGQGDREVPMGKPHLFLITVHRKYLIPNPLNICEFPDFFILFHAVLLLFSPYLFLVAMPDISILVVWVTQFSSVCVVSAMTISLQAHDCWVILFIMVCAAVMMVIDLQLRRVQMFRVNRALQEMLDERERNAEANHVMEMRHMIANVAHDLKTPLASFMTGLDLIALNLKDCSSSVPCESLSATHAEQTATDTSSSELQSNFECMASCLSQMRSTHAFMLMTINRCIDYTKASKGLKLVPKYETIDLRETLSLPLQCVRGLQSRVDIRIDELPEGVCAHIITDKQWLQENILCLLSNAVKYSQDGEVDVSFSLEDTDPDNYMSNLSASHDNKEAHSLRDSFSAHSSVHSAQSVCTQFLRFSVQDTGIGMSDEAMAQLFNPFKQTQRLAGGTGLGLYSLAKRLEALKGFYGVSRRPDGRQGSLFWLSIPYKPDRNFAELNDDVVFSVDKCVDQCEKVSNHGGGALSRALSLRDATPATEAEDPSSSSLPLSVNALSNADTLTHTPTKIIPKPHTRIPSKQIHSDTHHIAPARSLSILLVDDSPTIVKMSSLMLKRLGHDVSSAENGAVAVKMILQRWEELHATFDVVLMDLQMPIMDGLEATRRIRRMECEPEPADDEETNGAHAHTHSHAQTAEGKSGRSERSARSGALKPRQRIVGMSANSDEETAQEAVVAGVDAFMPKPFTSETLQSVFKRVMVNIT